MIRFRWCIFGRNHHRNDDVFFSVLFVFTRLIHSKAIIFPFVINRWVVLGTLYINSSPSSFQHLFQHPLIIPGWINYSYNGCQNEILTPSFFVHLFANIILQRREVPFLPFINLSIHFMHLYQCEIINSNFIPFSVIFYISRSNHPKLYKWELILAGCCVLFMCHHF